MFSLRRADHTILPSPSGLRRRRGLLLALSFVLATAASAPSLAGTIKFFAHFNLMQQTQPTVGVPADAWAMAGILYDPLTRDFSFNLIYDHLSSPITTLQLRGPAMKGVEGPLLYDLLSNNGMTSPMHHAATLTPQQSVSLFDQTLYMNLGTALNPQGEIRGQICILSVPEPSTAALALLAIGGGSIAACRRMRPGRR